MSAKSVKPKPKPKSVSFPHLQPEPIFYTVKKIAARWDVSTDTVSRRLERYRGEPGFKDWGTPADLKRHKRRYRILRIHADLLQKIEAE
jgi:hypothetical protein